MAKFCAWSGPITTLTGPLSRLFPCDRLAGVRVDLRRGPNKVGGNREEKQRNCDEVDMPCGLAGANMVA